MISSDSKHNSSFDAKHAALFEWVWSLAELLPLLRAAGCRESPFLDFFFQLFFTVFCFFSSPARKILGTFPAENSTKFKVARPFLLEAASPTRFSCLCSSSWCLYRRMSGSVQAHPSELNEDQVRIVQAPQKSVALVMAGPGR